ncbi:Uncharacterised protein [Mycobacteroides abscessus subsp. abscessus]|nr:Uncharacterised protein [Mycobacteroides abscessus subsp. abscessus]
MATTRNGSSGCGLRACHATNATSNTTAAIRQMTVPVSPQPSSAARLKPYTTSASPLPPRITPRMSRPGVWSVARGGSLISTIAPNSAIAANTTLMYMVQRQSRTWVNRPPSSSPTAAPPPAIAPKMPNAFARSLGAVNITVNSDNAAGARSAPNAPCSARAPKSMPWFSAAPPSAEASANPTNPTISARRRPHRSAMRPPKSSSPPNASAYAVMTHC